MSGEPSFPAVLQ